MSKFVDTCPDCGRACATDRVGEYRCVLCVGSDCDHVVSASSFESAIKKHNSIPRWHSYGEPPGDSQIKWVISTVGPLLARYTVAGWTDLNGFKIKILKWTEPPMDLPVRH